MLSQSYAVLAFIVTVSMSVTQINFVREYKLT